MKLIERKKVISQFQMKTFPMLAMEQFERLIMSHNVEFRGGFYINARGTDGMSRELYVPDTREVFCNTCQSLAILVCPSFSKEMWKKYGECIEELEELEKNFLKTTEKNDSVVLGEAAYDTDHDKIALEEYKIKKVKIYTTLYYSISQEFKTHRYWTKSTVDDE